MSQDQTLEADYQKGFNEGYIIAKELPELAQQLAKAVGNSERSLGFQHGRKELLLEQSREKYPAWLRGTRISRDSMDINKAESKEKDTDIEPEP